MLIYMQREGSNGIKYGNKIFNELTRWADHLGIHRVTWGGEQWESSGGGSSAAESSSDCPIRIHLSRCGAGDPGKDSCDENDKDNTNRQCKMPENIGTVFLAYLYG